MHVRINMLLRSINMPLDTTPLPDGAAARGVSEVIGVTLLIVFVVTVAALTIGLGSNSIQSVQGDAEITQAENAFAEIDARASTVALGEGPNQRTIDLGLNQQQRSNLHIEQDSHIRIESEALGEDVDCDDADYADESEDECTVLLDEELGTLKYEHGDTEVAYQTGGVWKMHDDGGTELITPPNVQYDDGTLTMPLVNIDNDPGQLGSDSLTFSRNGSEVPNRTSEPVHAEKVTVTITSRYYEAWGDYFENHVDGNVETTYDHDENTVEVELGLAGDIHGSFDSAIVANGDVYTDGDGDIYGPVMSSTEIDGNVHGYEYEHATINLFALDPHIEQMVQEAQNNPAYTDLGTIDSSTVISEGRYYADEIDLDSSDSVLANLATGDDNITIVVDGDITMENAASIHTTGSDNDTHVRVLTTGDFEMGQGSPDVTTAQGSEDFQVYAGGDANILISQDSLFEGVIYAPSDETNTHGGHVKSGGANCENTDFDVCIGSNAEVDGAIVGGSTMVGQSAELNYDESLADFSPKIEPEDTVRPRLLHLHVSVNDVTITP